MTESDAQSTLEEVIERYVNLGHEDPERIAELVMKELTEEALAEAMLALAPRVIMGLARESIRSHARQAENALIPDDADTSAKVKLSKYWVPGNGYMRGHEMSAADWRARGVWYVEQAAAHQRRAEWCFALAELIEQENVAKLGDVKADLPALPDREDEVELAA